MTYGYIRVSSDKQTVENQRFEINNFCQKESIKINGWIEETISGRNRDYIFVIFTIKKFYFLLIAFYQRQNK
jgi:hypothetical protein